MDDVESKRLKKKVEESLEENRNKYESTKLTLMTAGLLVALSLSPERFINISIFGSSAYKTTLFLIAILMVVMIIPYLLNDYAMNRVIRFLNSPNKAQSDWQKSRRPVKAAAVAIRIFGVLDILLFIVTVSLFVYMVVKM